MKPPAFQCYADDLLSGTSDMTAEEFGVYWRLICHSWNKGGLPNDDLRLALMAGQCSGNAVAYAKSKFEVGTDGLLRNPRLERVRAEQEQYREQQSQNAKIGWEKRRSPASADPVRPPVNGHAVAMPPHEGRQCSPTPTPTPIQERESRDFPEAGIPTWEEVKLMAEMAAVPEAAARGFFDHHDSKNLWRNRHGVMINVKACLLIWNNNQRQMQTNGRGRANGASVFELKTVMETKEKLAALLKNKHATEGPLSTDWTSPAKRAEYQALRREIVELQKKIANLKPQ